MRKLAVIFLLCALGVGFPVGSFGAMSSTNYYIYADAVEIGGGVLGTSSAYSLQGTLGEGTIGTASSTSYEIKAGYQYMERGSLSFSLSASSVALGTLSVSAVSSGSLTATVDTDSLTGYTLAISSVSGTGLAAVADGTVSAGAEEYGLAVSGSEAAFSNDRAIQAGQAIASTSSPMTVPSATSITIKAAISDSSVAGSRSQSIVLTASANI